MDSRDWDRKYLSTFKHWSRENENMAVGRDANWQEGYREGRNRWGPIPNPGWKYTFSTAKWVEKDESKCWVPLEKLPNSSLGISTVHSSKPNYLVSRLIHNRIETANHKGKKSCYRQISREKGKLSFNRHVHIREEKNLWQFGSIY